MWRMLILITVQAVHVHVTNMDRYSPVIMTKIIETGSVEK